ncbi:MAG TPA: peptidase S41 [Clostridiales bacterium UBA8960]|nr:peptidase S41 [Clostridiales bacterium UBA8960]
MAQKNTVKKDPKALLREKKLKKQRRKTIMKSALAIILVLLMVGMALAPVFGESYTANDTYRGDGHYIVSDAQIKLAISSSTAEPDVKFHDFIDFMMNTVEGNYYKDVNKQTLIEGAYKGIFSTLDPYSTYFTPKEYANFNTSIQGEFSGIGASITEGKNGYVEVVSPIKGTPADRAGLQPGDWIVEIDGIDASGFTTEKAVSMIRGPKGTPVKLTIRRAGINELLYFTIVRDTIIIKSVNFEVLEGGIGYIELTEFSSKTNSEFSAAMAHMVNQNIKKVIVDVRNNPGGLLDTAIYVSDFFIPSGKEIVIIDYKGTNDRTYRASTAKSPVDVVVLTNGGSASASEIFAGSVQQTGNGIVIGEKTFGKGTVQNLMPLTNGGAVKLTVAEYLLTGNYKVDTVGIIPDIEVAAPARLTDAIVASLAPMVPSKGMLTLNIYAAQQRLNLLGYSITADGQNGPETRAIVSEFQRRMGLYVSGALNEATMKAIEAELKTSAAKTFDPQLERAIVYMKTGK